MKIFHWKHDLLKKFDDHNININKLTKYHAKTEAKTLAIEIN